MEPLLFETKPPFVLKVYYTYFQITWEDTPETPQDKYSYVNVTSVKIVTGKKERSLIEHFYRLFLQNQYAKRIADYDEVLIEFRNGEKETRYVHGQVSEAISEAVEIINSKLNVRELKTN